MTPAVRPVTLKTRTFPTFRSWNPATKLANVFTVDTSSLYDAAPTEAAQWAVILAQVAPVPAPATGGNGIEKINAVTSSLVRLSQPATV